MNRKGAVWLLWMVVALGIIVVSGQYLIGRADIASLFGATLQDGCTVVEGKGVIPLMGYFECKQMPGTFKMYPITTGWGWDPYQTIYCNEYTDECRFYRCANEYCSGSQEYLGSTYAGGAFETPHQLYEYWIKKSYEPYNLWLETPTGTSGWYYTNDATYGCDLPYFQDYCMAGDICMKGVVPTSNKLAPGYATNFFEKWVIGPTEFNFVQWGTQRVYCAGQGVIYSTNTVSLQSGCYMYPQEIIGDEECCPGQVAGSAICGDDFKWGTVTPSGCISDFQCPEAGQWKADYADETYKTSIRYKCVDSDCVPDRITTECTTSFGCPSGYMCNYNPATGLGSCISESDSPPGIPQPPGIFEGNFVNWLMMWFTALVLSFIILWMSQFLPVPFFKIFSNWKMLIIGTVVLSLILLAVFSLPIAGLKASIFGG